MSAKMKPAAETASTFKSMSQSSAEDWQVICTEARESFTTLPPRLLTHLRLLDGDFGGFPVDRLQHSLQTAELAAADGRDDEYVVCALLHDIGDTLAPANHPDVAAAILYPFVDEANHWMVKHHGVFQGYNFFHHLGMDRDMREQYRSSDYFDYTAEFIAKYDDPAFDADKPTLDLALFEPMVARVFAQAKNSIYKVLQG